MRRNPLILLLLFFFVLLLAGCDSGPKLGKLSQGDVVLAFGDSLTRGTGAGNGESYPDVLAGLLGLPVVNAGIPGEVSAEGRARLPQVLDAHRPRLVILCHGGNDFLRRLDTQQTGENLKAMIEEIRSRGADVLLVGVPKLEFGLNVPKFYRELAEAYTVPYEGEILLKLLGDSDFRSDRIHPNAEGYRRFAEAVHQRILKAQKK